MRQRSAARTVQLVVTAAAVLFAGAFALTLAWTAQQDNRSDAEHVTRATAIAIAAMPRVAEAVALPPASATAELQPIAETIIEQAGVDFVTLLTVTGTRLTHPNPERIGEHYLGTIPKEPSILTEEYQGTLGPSIRTIVPIMAGSELRGWVAVGITLDSVETRVVNQLPLTMAWTLAALAAGAVVAHVARRSTQRIAGGLSATGVRDAVLARESIQTLARALRVQEHEHGNRLHTAIGLIELGHTEQAIELLAATSTRNQRLVDQLAEHSLDPIVAGLLIGKAATAYELGIDWEADWASSQPRLPLQTEAMISLLGNLIDNALDASASGPEPRWVRVLVTDQAHHTVVTVANSGRSITPEVESAMFGFGYSTKADPGTAHGVGLALVREIVSTAGGTIEVRPESPVEFTIRLPVGTHK